MQQNDDNSQVITNKANTPSEDKIEDIEDWRNEHGQPSYKFLKSLADDGTKGAIEKLRSIAEDLDVDYGQGESIEELIRKILSAAESRSNTTT